MAENKTSFILYTDLILTVSKLDDKKAGRLFKHILDYVNDKDPVSEDLVIQIAFEPIKQHLKRDLKKWENYLEKQKSNGAKGGRPSKSIPEENPNETQKTQAFFEKPKKADSVNVSVSVNDSVNVSEGSTAPDLKKSNLFRQPSIPKFEDVVYQFKSCGGNEHQAQKFFDKYNSTGWYLSGSPIVNFKSLIPKFIENWLKNEKANGKFIKRTESNGSQLASTAIIEPDKTYNTIL